ncbi:MAG: hypothetical protein Q7J44_14085 [Pseudotabrizicola sp.]|uniref:hypothetical protein n=1 Tax=Pseudotabrizicola sp. TaxID=2939647 RepID=UPI0027212366|nr:hypothetical protein [Pseudotabrizicola sp.]MDO9639665.1 hypothetical protein [Pseudotabrizicola sp.]
MKRASVRVSDHALLRHMQRVMDLPVEDLRAELERRINAIYLEGATGITMDGHSYRVVINPFGAVVTTVIDTPGRHAHRPIEREAEE